MSVQAIRAAVFDAHEQAIAADVSFTIICYIGGAIRPWATYPDCARFSAV